MKFIQDLYKTLRIVLQFGRQHHAALAMMNGMYARQSERNELVVAGSDTTLFIKPYGSLYQVTRIDYIGNKPECEQTWLATYGWHSNGHLIEIGGDRYCIFDTASQLMYLETITTQGQTTVELFTKNL